MFNWFFSSFFFDLAQAVTNGDPLQAYASMQPYAGIGKFWNMTVLIKFKKKTVIPDDKVKLIFVFNQRARKMYLLTIFTSKIALSDHNCFP